MNVLTSPTKAATSVIRAAKSLLFLVLLVSSTSAELSYPRPGIIPVPASVSGVSEPVVLLNGIWKFSMTAPSDFYENHVDPSTWPDIRVPGEAWMQGFPIAFDAEYPCKREIDIPADYAGQRIFIRFDGVYSDARVWIDGFLVGSHQGGFNSWQVEITDHVSAGQSAWLTVAFKDKSSDVSYATGYAQAYLNKTTRGHRIGGILRDVVLFAVPPVHLVRVHATTDLDASYTDATLQLEVGVDFSAGSAPVDVGFELTDPSGGNVPLTPSLFTVSPAQSNAVFQIPVVDPLKWDAEHPWLYTLTTRLYSGGQVLQTATKKIGFREVEIADNRLLVNGADVKLRGGCRHSIHPREGRAHVPWTDEADVKLYKEANINFIRTSHYPTTPSFLELCDQYGIYVDEEAAMVWRQINPGETDNPAYADIYIREMAEMVERDMSHPSIIMWSLANESYEWGQNFEEERDYARAVDPSRLLTIGVNPDGLPHGLDFISGHYPAWNSDFNKSGLPYLFDEAAHVACYYEPGSVLDTDPNSRHFWGESLKKFWDGIYSSSGTAGMAIWGTIDEVFYTPWQEGGYGRWGIFDGWRRPKPEHWLTKKAYSPVRIGNAPLGHPGTGNSLFISVTNRFDHTNFNELEITWKIGDESGVLASDLAPGAAGELVVPSRDWRDNDIVELSFIAHQPGYSYLVDEFHLPLIPCTTDFPAPQGPTPALSETATDFTVAGDQFEIVFDKATAQIRSASYGGETFLVGGPLLNLFPMYTGPLLNPSIAAYTVFPFAVVMVTGNFDGINVAFELKIDGNGLIQTSYTVANPPAVPSVYSEVGVAFVLDRDVDRLEWDRKGLYSIYPVDHISRNTGVAIKFRPGPGQAYRQEPAWPWILDMKDFHMNGTNDSGYGMTAEFRGAKEYIYSASLTRSTRTAVALADDADPSLNYVGSWYDYSDPGNHEGTEKYSNEAGAYVEYDFDGTSVRWIGPKNFHHGLAEVYLDGVYRTTVDTYYASTKLHQQVLYEATGLPDGPHTLKVVVLGTKSDSSLGTFIVIDAFSPVPPSLPGDSGNRIRVESDGLSHAVRIGKSRNTAPTTDDRDPALYYSGMWSDLYDGGDYAGTERYSNQTGAYVEHYFSRTSVRWIGTKYVNMGKADVYLDGVFQETVDAYDGSGSKQYRQVLYEKTGLSAGSHTLKVVVRGEKNAASSGTYVLIDAFSALPPPPVDNTLLHVNRQWAYELGWGNYSRSSQIGNNFSDTVNLRLSGGAPAGSTPIMMEIGSPEPVAGSRQVQLQWTSEPGAFYRVEWSDDLDDWNLLEGFIPSQGDISAFDFDLVETLGFEPEAAFFRIEVEF